MKSLVVLLCVLGSIQRIRCLIEMGGGILDRFDYSRLALGGYFDVHDASAVARNRCGKIRSESGVLQVEAMRYAIDQVNRNNSELLFGLKLGYYILDSCSNRDTIRQNFLSMMFLTRNIGIVGPPMSNEAVFVASLSGILDIPVISPTASSSSMDDRVKYYNIFRAIPSDAVQVAAVVNILLRFNWTYVSAVSSSGYNGEYSLNLLVSIAAEKGICIARRSILPGIPNSEDYSRAVENLKSDPKANVVVLLTTARDTEELLKAVGNENRFAWVSGTGWPIDMNITRNITKNANFSLILKYVETEDEGFKKYFLSLKLKQNRYTWFREFWSNVFDCNAGLTGDSRPKCAGNESLATSSINFDFKSAKRIIYAVESFACVLRKILIKWCPSKSLRCLRSVGSGLLIVRLEVIKQLAAKDSTCVGLNDSKVFNKFGYLPEDMRVLRFNGSGYEEIGVWLHKATSERAKLVISLSSVTKNGSENLPVSICSSPCKLGEVKLEDETWPKCCFSCRKCPDNNIIKNNTCKQCGKYQAASQDYSICNELPQVRVSLSSKLSLPTIIASGIGFCLNTIFLGLFIKHRNSRIVKAASRELSFIIFLSLYACFASPFAFLVAPSRIICGIQRLIVGMSLTGCYTPLMLRTNRIYRIFKASEVLRYKPPFVSPKSQILICLCLLGMQLLLGVMWLVGDRPEVIKMVIEDRKKVAEICKYDSTFIIFLNLIPCFVLMAISTVYAFRTRKFPTNFNEAHSTSVTMCITCFLWGIFIPITLLLKATSQSVFLLTYIISNFTVIIGLVTLIGLFGPKLKKLVYFQAVNSTQERFHGFQLPASSNDPTVTTGGAKSTCDEDKSVRHRVSVKDVGTNT